jgi:hypothetical protein
MASHGLDPDVVAADMAKAGVNGCVIDVPKDYTLALTADFATNRHRLTVDRNSNLSVKRNLGLLIGHMSGGKVFFLDDDIRSLSATQLRRASAQLERYTVAGFLPKSYPDNSVVCHANRLAGGEQGIFISGSTLAVNAALPMSFFPQVYNEDWLFFHDAVRARRAALIGEARQLGYDPFVPGRPSDEEFGDVLAEGLYYLLEAGVSYESVDEDFWRYFLWKRGRFIANIARRLAAVPEESDMRASRALLALSESKRQLDDCAPRDFTEYTRAWHTDVDRWQQRLAALPSGLSFDEAVHFTSKTFGLSVRQLGVTR